MGVFKIIGKTLGTATLVTTGVASAILKGVSDTVGFEIGSEVLSVAKDASFNGVRSIWSDKDLEFIDKMECIDYKVENVARSQMARTAKQAADIARRNGDIEKYEQYMDINMRYTGTSVERSLYE